MQFLFPLALTGPKAVAVTVAVVVFLVLFALYQLGRRFVVPEGVIAALKAWRTQRGSRGTALAGSRDESSSGSQDESAQSSEGKVVRDSRSRPTRGSSDESGQGSQGKAPGEHGTPAQGPRRTSVRRRLVSWLAAVLFCASVAGGITGFTWFLLERWWKPFGGEHMPWVYTTGGIVVGVICALLVARRCFFRSLVSCVVAVLALASSINHTFVLYPTVGAIAARDPYVQVSYRAVAAPMALMPASDEPLEQTYHGRSLRKVGAVVDYQLRSPLSKFTSSTSKVYLPPAYFSNPRPQLPVLVLLNGLPGTTSDWFSLGEAGDILDTFQRAHNGLSPIVVTVDPTGGGVTDFGCFDGTQEKVMTYLTKDVPAQIKKAFQVSSDPTQWAIGGFSYGGTCSLQAVAYNPEPYRYFLDLSGDKIPGKGNDADNIATYFNGDEAAYRAQNPIDLLTTKKYSGITGRFVAGTRDQVSEDAGAYLTGLANAAGMSTEALTVDGGHDYNTWRSGLSGALPTIAKATRLTG